MVFVECMTFNHHAYIEDAMNGFCMQETNFPFVCVIVDDASTDGEQEVIKLYFDTHFNLLECGETDDYTMTFGQHKTNKNCYFVGLYLKYNHYSIKKDKVPYYSRWRDDCKYIALCEGDDYWIAKEKLQKQVDYLEDNDEYSMVFHSAEIIYKADYQTGLQCSDIKNREYSPNEVFATWIVPTASILARKEVYNIKNKNKYKILNGDIIFILNCAKIGKLRGMSDKMSIYRVQEHGVTYDISLKIIRIFQYPDHFKYIKDNYPFIKRRLINYRISHAYVEKSSYEASLLNKIKDLICAVYYRPFLIYKLFVKIIRLNKI